MSRLTVLSRPLADGDPPAARRVTGAIVNAVVGLTMIVVCLLAGGLTGERRDLLIAAGAMAVAQVLVLAIRVPGPGDWALLTFLQALTVSTGIASLTADQDALVPLLALNLAWASVMLPTWVVAAALVWNLAALMAPMAGTLLWGEPSTNGYTAIEAAVGAVAFVMIALVGRAQARSLRSSQERSDKESRTDALTGLFNRRHTGEALIAETRLAARTERPCAVMLVDIDHFKQVNDTYGHSAGDEVLIAVARRIVARARSGDLATRWGGEEFLLLARDVPDQAALASLAEDVRQSCRGSIRISGGTTIPVTVSVGAALSTDYPTSPTLLEAADRALYAAKGAGRDCCRVAAMAQMLGEPSVI